jgi:alpha-ribazole phosphatase
MPEKDLYLLRHGETGKQGRYIGSMDVPLSETGREQVRGTAKLLRRKNIDTIFSSPMRRCRQTCELLEIDCPNVVSPLLREVDFGQWEGKSFGEIVACDPAGVDRWTSDPETFCFPGGEPLAAFRHRVSTFKKILDNNNGKRLLLVAHGGVIRHLLCSLMGLPSEKYLLFDVQPGSFTSLRVYSDGAVLTGFNIFG